MQNERKANDQRTSKRRNRPSPWPMLRNALCRRKITMRASARLLFAIAFIGGMDNAALAGSRAALADLLGQGYEVVVRGPRSKDFRPWSFRGFHLFQLMNQVSQSPKIRQIFNQNSI